MLVDRVYAIMAVASRDSGLVSVLIDVVSCPIRPGDRLAHSMKLLFPWRRLSVVRMLLKCDLSTRVSLGLPFRIIGVSVLKVICVLLIPVRKLYRLARD